MQEDHLSVCSVFKTLSSPQWNFDITKPPKDGQNLFAIKRFRYISSFFFIYLTITGVKKMVRFIEDFVV